MVNSEVEYVVVGRTNPKCPWCDRLISYLESKGVDYTYIDIEEPGMREYFAKEGLRTVPQFWHRGTRIGSYEQTVVYLNGILK